MPYGELEFVDRIDGMREPHSEGSYAKFFVNATSIDGSDVYGAVIITEQQALDLARDILGVFSNGETHEQGPDTKT